MKFTLEFKSPETLYTLKALFSDDENEEYIVAKALVSKFLRYNEYLTVEFDMVTNQAKVVPNE